MNSGHFGFPNILGLLRATAFRAIGKPGATAGTALAGATTSGAPTSGQFDAGDVVVGQDGTLWICTAAGSPGDFTGPALASSPLVLLPNPYNFVDDSAADNGQPPDLILTAAGDIISVYGQ